MYKGHTEKSQRGSVCLKQFVEIPEDETLGESTLGPKAEPQMCFADLVNSEAATTTPGGKPGVGGRQILFETRFHGSRRIDTEIPGALA